MMQFWKFETNKKKNIGKFILIKSNIDRMTAFFFSFKLIFGKIKFSQIEQSFSHNAINTQQSFTVLDTN